MPRQHGYARSAVRPTCCVAAEERHELVRSARSTQRLRALRQAYALVPSRSGLTLRLGHAPHTATPSAANAAAAIIAVGG